MCTWMERFSCSIRMWWFAQNYTHNPSAKFCGSLIEEWRKLTRVQDLLLFMMLSTCVWSLWVVQISAFVWQIHIVLSDISPFNRAGTVSTLRGLVALSGRWFAKNQTHNASSKFCSSLIAEDKTDQSARPTLMIVAHMLIKSVSSASLCSPLALVRWPHCLGFHLVLLGDGFGCLFAEFSKVAFRTGVGCVVMGFIGFFVKLLFIPINNIIIGSTWSVHGYVSLLWIFPLHLCFATFSGQKSCREISVHEN